MKPPRFDYLRAESLDEVHDALGEDGDEARVIAGGQSLVPMLSMRLASPKLLIDIMHLPQLAGVERDNGRLRIGAAVTQAALLARPALADEQPLLAAALPWVGHAQTRSRGTICGSVAHADPSAEIPLALLALDGAIELSSRRGRRSVPARDFFTGLMSTARHDDEMIETVTFPTRCPGEGHAFREYGRRHGDFAIIACAAIARDRGIRFAVGGVADVPTARDLPDLTDAALDDALAAFADELDAADDLHATAAYRRGLVRRLGLQTIAEARRCRT